MITRPARATDAPAAAALVSQLGYEAPEAEVTARAVRVMRLWSSTSRAPAHRFYEGLGYGSVKTQHSFVKPLDERGETRAARLVPRVDSTP